MGAPNIRAMFSKKKLKRATLRREDLDDPMAQTCFSQLREKDSGFIPKKVDPLLIASCIAHGAERKAESSELKARRVMG